MNASDVPRLAVALGLGELQGQAASLKSDDSNPVWAAKTALGEWIIKTERPPGAWWFDARAKSGDLELAVRRAGVPIATPADDRGDVGLWHDVGDDVYARALHRVAGHRPTTPASPDLATWIGASLAAIEKVSPPAAAASDSGYRTYSSEQWQEWISESIAEGIIGSREGADLHASVAVLNEVIMAGRALGLPHQRLRRDPRPDKIMITDAGPMLLDFDHAGPQAPWWEFVGQSFELASPVLGVVEPSRPTIEAALSSYVSEGGTPGQADVTAFTGILAARLVEIANLMWAACRHHETGVRRRAVQQLRDEMAGLPAIRTGIAGWSRWLSG